MYMFPRKSQILCGCAMHLVDRALQEHTLAGLQVSLQACFSKLGDSPEQDEGLVREMV
jgi:hypothetical protein